MTEFRATKASPLDTWQSVRHTLAYLTNLTSGTNIRKRINDLTSIQAELYAGLRYYLQLNGLRGLANESNIPEGRKTILV